MLTIVAMGLSWAEKEPSEQQDKNEVRTRKNTKRGGEYTNRIRRFHSDRSIVVVGDNIYIINDHGYYDGEDWDF